MIPQNNPLANYLTHKPAIDAAISRVLTRGHYVLGDETITFEQQFADYTNTEYAVSVGSGTEALHLALRGCGVGPGDEVITVSHTAVASIAAIEMCGAAPVVVDIDPSSYTIDPQYVEGAITERTKALVPVHLYGQPSDLKPLVECARRHHLFLIEDCAQSHGALYHGRKVGVWGDAGAFSFYPTKNLGCLGDGGAVVTNSSDLYHKLLALRQYGWDQERISRVVGYNSRLDELQAAVLQVKLQHLDENNRKRRSIARTYGQLLDSLNIILPAEILGSAHVYHQYVIRCQDRSTRDNLRKIMLQRGIQSAIHYPVPVHLQPAYISRLGSYCSFPVTEKICETIISLPMFPELTQEDLDKITTVIRQFFQQTG